MPWRVTGSIVTIPYVRSGQARARLARHLDLDRIRQGFAKLILTGGANDGTWSMIPT
jgi:hypothetical protein